MSRSEAEGLIQQEVLDSGYCLPATKQVLARLDALIEHTGYRVEYETDFVTTQGVTIRLVPIGDET